MKKIEYEELALRPGDVLQRQELDTISYALMDRSAHAIRHGQGPAPE